MDLVDYDEARYEEIKADTAFTADLGFRSVDFLPVSALFGVNIVEPTKIKCLGTMDTLFYDTLRQSKFHKYTTANNSDLPLSTFYVQTWIIADMQVKLAQVQSKRVTRS